jgi:cyclopropane-fatty-acyl-phospholipid synthase
MQTTTIKRIKVVSNSTPPQGGEVSKKFIRIAKLIGKQYTKLDAEQVSTSFALKSDTGHTQTFGSGKPAFTILLNNDDAVTALSTLNQNTIVEAYLKGNIDIEGNIMSALSLRELFDDKKGFNFLWRFIQPLLFGQVKSDKKWIANHYDIEADFFLLFLDTRHRAYSQAVFKTDGTSLEDAETCKLDFALKAVNAKPGDRILDIGSGWGAVVEYAGRKGIRVTSLTISKRSKDFVDRLIENQNLPCEVLLEHFLEHQPGQQYDAIINCGVTEHLPNYAASLKHYQKLLKPGGYLYLDASADKQKHGHGSFMSKYVFEGNASLLCLHEYLGEVAKTPFQLAGVWDDRHNYYLTTKAWAQKLDAHRQVIEQRWGKQLYRIFQLYLWGSAEGFKSGMIEAYRVVLTLPAWK